MTKQVDTLIISGASITASPWFTWADVLIEILQPKRVINLATKGTGNRWISLSLIDTISALPSDQCVVCAAMFTNIDKFDMFLPNHKTHQYLNQKHPPIDLKGRYVKSGPSFWCTGSHWPLEKEIYLKNFFDPVITAVDTMVIFNCLSQVCQQKNFDLIPLFDSYIWNIFEKDLNEFVNGVPLPDRDILKDPMVNNFSKMLDKKFFQFVPLINWAIDNNLPYYNDINKMHPPSQVHLEWVKHTILSELQTRYQCNTISCEFSSMIKNLSQEWN
jgi:hypothetical protein